MFIAPVRLLGILGQVGILLQESRQMECFQVAVELGLMDKSVRHVILTNMSKREFELTEQALTELWLAYDSTADPKAQRRLQAVRLYGQGRPMADVEQIVGTDKRSVLRWCAQYRQHGIAGLVSQWRGGNNAKLTGEQRQEVKERLHQYRPDDILAPDVRISQGAYWTLSDLQLCVQQWYGVSWQSETSYRTLFHECGFSLQRPAKVYRQRPDEQTIADFEAALEKK